MALLKNTAEGGTNGTTAGTHNTGAGSGSVFSSVTATTFKTVAARHGTLGYAIAPADTANGFIQLTDTADATSWAAQWYARWTGAPNSTHQFARFLSISNAIVASIQVDPASGSIQAVGASSFIGSAAGTIKWGTWYRFACRGVTGSSGLFAVEVYEGDSSTRVVYGSWPKDMGSNGVASLRLGKVTPAPIVPEWHVDTISFNAGATTWLPPEIPTSQVAANAGKDLTAEVGEAVGLCARGWDNANNRYVKTGTFAQLSGPAVTLTNTTTPDGVGIAKFTVPASAAGSTLAFRLTHTDTTGAQATDDVYVTVPPRQRFVWNGSAWI